MNPERTPFPGPRLARKLPMLLGSAAFLAVLLTLGDPGITVDEPLDVRPGRTYIETLVSEGWGFFAPGTVEEVFGDNAEHPPLGRWLLGIASKLGEPFEVMWIGPDPIGLYVRAGRLAPAAAFGVLVGVVSAAAGRRYGRAAGAVAGFALLVMPRAFAHAHLGALDTFVALFWTMALLSAARATEARRPVAALAGAGVLWGLALLTKIHAWLLPPIVLIWVLWRLRWRGALAGFALWAALGLAVFFVGWPWLWYETADRLRDYLGTGVDRLSIRVEYFGRVYADRDVPWHYPWLYFAATVPVGLHVVGVLGLVRGWRDPFVRLLSGSILAFLVLFSTRVPVYDGERLFLPVFPLWAVLIGRGAGWIGEATAGRGRLRAVLAGVLMVQAYGALALHPFGLSYYNALVLGLPGAERLGLELTCWGDAVDDVLLDRLAREARPGQTAALAPTLAPNQGVYATNRDLLSRSIVLQDEQAAGRADWVVIYRRRAYWTPEVRRLARGGALQVRSRQGVWLSGLWRRRDGSGISTGSN